MLFVEWRCSIDEPTVAAVDDTVIEVVTPRDKLGRHERHDADKVVASQTEHWQFGRGH